PALDAGDNADAPEWDQRGPGYPRIVNGTTDMGAFEVQLTDGPGSPLTPIPAPDGDRPAPIAPAQAEVTLRQPATILPLNDDMDTRSLQMQRVIRERRETANSERPYLNILRRLVEGDKTVGLDIHGAEEILLVLDDAEKLMPPLCPYEKGMYPPDPGE